MSTSSLNSLFQEMAQLHLKRDELKHQLDRLNDDISELQANIQVRSATLLTVDTSNAKIYRTAKELFLDMLKIKISKLDDDFEGGKNQDDAGVLRDFIIEMKRILASEVAEDTELFHYIRAHMDPKFYCIEIENLIVEILELFDKWIE